MRRIQNLIWKVFVIFMLISDIAYAQITPFDDECSRPKKVYDMEVNNVRARLLTGGDLFYDANYITPLYPKKSSPVSGIFAVGVWASGTDAKKAVRLSAVTYRNEGFDFTTGPLNDKGLTEKISCDQWDNIFSVNGTHIKSHIKAFQLAKANNQSFDCKSIPVPDDIRYWPAQGNMYFVEKYGWELPDQPLAGFYDMNADGRYDPCDGDYPMTYTGPNNCLPYHLNPNRIPATINYFVFNDAGRMQTLSSEKRLNMEFHVHAYAYNTSDALNDITFYQYKIINKSIRTYSDFRFSWWMDPDLGCYKDDFIGSDPNLKLAYIYNRDAIDGVDSTGSCQGIASYGSDIPIVGIDFVEGFEIDQVFLRDSQGDFIRDKDGNKILDDPELFSGNVDTLVKSNMTSFMYGYSLSPGYNPDSAKILPEFNFMRGKWGDGSNVTVGGLGCDPDGKEITRFVFTGDPNNPDGWSMGNVDTLLPATFDLRTIMSAGPITLPPGASQTLTIAVMSVLDTRYPKPDLTKLKYTDRYLKSMFENCFEYVSKDTPDCPEILGISKDRSLQLKLDNLPSSNNYNEKFTAVIPGIDAPLDSLYRFEGYKIYQVKDRDVKYSQLNQPEYARLIGQTDIKNGIKDIYSFDLKLNPDLSSKDTYIWTKTQAIDGANKGLQKVFTIDEDVFADGDDKRLVNYKEYYFAAVAYAYNNWKDFDATDVSGQKVQYLEGSGNFKVFTFAPKIVDIPKTVKPVVTRISGEGNPHVFLEMNENMYEKILKSEFDGKVVYKPDAGPVRVIVHDPKKAEKKKLRIEISGDFLSNNLGTTCRYDTDAYWTVTDVNTNTVVLDRLPLNKAETYRLEDYGVSLVLHNFLDPGTQVYDNNGAIGQTITYKDSKGNHWLDAVKPGGVVGQEKFHGIDFTMLRKGDPLEQITKIGNQFFLPASSLNTVDHANFPLNYAILEKPVLKFMTSDVVNMLKYSQLNNVDIILTKDKSKWSKCVVLETTPTEMIMAGYQTEGNVPNSSLLRRVPSIDQNGNLLNDWTIGFGYFPGYAVDVETGKRLNIFFGESSLYNHGKDLLFNPDDELVDENLLVQGDKRGYVFGGHHYIYVTRSEYDGCAGIHNKLKYSGSGSPPSTNARSNAFSQVTWVSWPIAKDMTSLSEGLIPNDVIVKLRVDNTYSPSSKFDIQNVRGCIYYNDHPVYEIGFEKSTTDIDPVLGEAVVIPNPSELTTTSVTIRLSQIPSKGRLDIMDAFGKIEETILFEADKSAGSYGHVGDVITIPVNNANRKPGMYLIRVIDTETGVQQTGKWMVF